MFQTCLPIIIENFKQINKKLFDILASKDDFFKKYFTLYPSNLIFARQPAKILIFYIEKEKSIVETNKSKKKL